DYDSGSATTRLVTSAQSAFAPTGHTTSDDFALLSVPYNVDGSVANPTDPTGLTNFANIGSTWGLAHKRTSNTVYIAAFLKRHAGLAVHGLDGIYVYDAAGSSFLGGFDLTNATNTNTASNGGAINFGSITRSHIATAITSGSGGDNQLTSD